MAHFAQVNADNLVTNVIVVANDAIDGGNYPESEPIGQAFLADCGLEGEWLQCSYSGSFRGTFPGLGSQYDPALDIFTSEETP
jgi:hypothetical protein